MPIITQLNATKLRSLKYGNDTSDGGNSGQPYVKTELKDIDKPFTRFRLTKFDDGLIRGGAIGALNASVVDTIRIGKFLKDFPKGPLFLAKQVGLQLSNPKLESKKGLGGLVGNVGSTRLYNLGINTLAQVPLNAFGGHLMRHGLLPVMDESTKYINVVAENNKIADDNRLVSLTNKFNLGDNEGDISKQFNLKEARRENRAVNRAGRQANREANRQGRRANRLVNQSLREGAKTEGFEFVRSKFTRTDFKRNKLDTKTLTIDSYNGGPKSVYGIGRTIINRYAFTEDKIKITEAYDTAKQKTISGSLSFNPLKEESGFINNLGNYVTGSITEPILTSPVVIPLYGIRYGGLDEEDQFNALSRKRQPKDFLYGVNNSAPTTTLQNVIGDGEITIIEGSNSTNTPINPETDISPDKFSVFKTTNENTEYIGGYRRIKVQQETEGSIGQIGDRGPTTKIFTGKTQAEVDAQLATGSLFNNPRTLDEVVVTSRASKTVKASIVNVSNMEGGLEAFYKSGEMVSSPETEISHTISNGTLFETQDVSVNRSSKTGFYFNGNRVVPNFDRVDRDIMLVSFDTIDPFTAADARNVVFSAYLSGFKYNSNSNWNPVKYVGRSESFYTFTEHKRDVSFNIQIPCFNKTHLFEKHRALSELQSAGAGKYDSNNRLGGIITKVTLGNYLVSEPGILTSVSFDIPDVSSWDIDEKLAMYVNAQFSFTIIGKELPTYKEGGFLNYLPNPISGTGYLTGSQAR
jgi:hypothetical protein